MSNKRLKAGSRPDAGTMPAPSKNSPFTSTTTIPGVDIYSQVRSRLIKDQSTAGFVQAKCTIVRRIKEDRTWNFVYLWRTTQCFDGGFEFGIVCGVTFVHDAPPMFCEPRYNSTGEAHGTIYTGDITKIDFSLFDEVVTVAYDPEKRRFFVKDHQDRTLDGADILVLRGDGSAVACTFKPGILS